MSCPVESNLASNLREAKNDVTWLVLGALGADRRLAAASPCQAPDERREGRGATPAESDRVAKLSPGSGLQAPSRRDSLEAWAEASKMGTLRYRIQSHERTEKRP